MTTIDRYGVMGYPVSHSRSPVIHRLFALQTSQNLQYELLQVAPEKLEAAVRQFQRTGGKGLNITVPHKSEVARICDQLSERASTAGAVNTLSFRDGEILGDNTDGIGLLRDLVINLGITLEGANILVLGAGGATRGIIIGAELLEFGALGLATSLLAVLIATITAWALCTFAFDLDFLFAPMAAIQTVLLALVLVLGVGAIATWRVLSVKAAPYLRAE